MSQRKRVVSLLGIALVVVVAAVLSLAGSAFAVSSDRTMYNEGTGQAVIYPYWRADGSTDTLFEIVNRITPLSPKIQDSFTGFATDRKGRWVLVHMTIRESKVSEESLNFNLCLSPGDVWTGTLTLDGTVTKLISNDNTPSNIGIPINTELDPVVGPPTNPIEGYIEGVMVDNGTNPVTRPGPGVT